MVGKFLLDNKLAEIDIPFDVLLGFQVSKRLDDSLFCSVDNTWENPPTFFEGLDLDFFQPLIHICIGFCNPCKVDGIH